VDLVVVAAMHTSLLQYRRDRYFVFVQGTAAKVVVILLANKAKLDVIRFFGDQHRALAIA
jgi:hypothetical protein